jgi:hypothetical protein
MARRFPIPKKKNRQLLSEVRETFREFRQQLRAAGMHIPVAQISVMAGVSLTTTRRVLKDPTSVTVDSLLRVLHSLGGTMEVNLPLAPRFGRKSNADETLSNQ